MGCCSRTLSHARHAAVVSCCQSENRQLDDKTTVPTPDDYIPKISGGVSAELAKEVVNRDQKLAAYFLITFATLTIVGELLSPQPASSNVAPYISGGIDLLIGSCLIMGLYTFLICLKIRLAVGIVFGLVATFLGNQPAIGIATIAYAGSLSLLVFGKVSKPRRITAIVLLTILILLTLLGVIAIALGIE